MLTFRNRFNTLSVPENFLTQRPTADISGWISHSCTVAELSFPPTKGGALWLMHYTSGFRQNVSSSAAHWFSLSLRPFHSAYLLNGATYSCRVVKALIQSDIMDATSFMLSYVWALIKHSTCLSTLPSPLLYPACHFAWQSPASYPPWHSLAQLVAKTIFNS